MNRLFKPLDTELRKALDALPDAIDAVMPLRTTHRRDLPRAIQELSASLTSERGNLSESYWASPRLFSAYVRHFLPWNVFRLGRLLPSLALPTPEQCSGGHILDVGSGPFTLPIALWMARPELRTVPLTLTCGDISPHVLDVGRDLFRAIAGEECPWSIHTLRGTVENALRENYGKNVLVMGGNVLNELQPRTDQLLEDRLGEVAEAVRDSLAPGGKAFFIEPGSRLGGKLVSMLRQAAIENGLAPEAPCPHHNECPMLAAKRSSWCHFTFSVHDAPEWLTNLSQEAGFERDTASLSFVLMGRAETPPTDDNIRVISAVFPVPGRREPVRYGCSAEGLTLIYDARPLISGALVQAAWPEEPRTDNKSGGLFAGWVDDEGTTHGLTTPHMEMTVEESAGREDSPRHDDRVGFSRKPRGFDGREGGFRARKPGFQREDGERGFGGRPGGGRPGGDRAEGGFRREGREDREGGFRKPAFRNDGEGFARKPREFGAEGGAPRERDGNRRDFGDRKPRDFGGRPGGDRPEGGFRREGREEREGGFRKPAFRNDGEGFARKPREFGGEGGAPRERDGNRRDFGDRKPRDFGDRREGGFKRDFGGRPGGDKRSFGDRPEGGFRREGREDREGGFRKPAFRNDGEGFARKPRDFGGEGGAPRERDGNRRDFGDRKPRDFGDRREGGFKRDFGGRPGGDRPEGGFRREGREDREGGFRKPAFRNDGEGFARKPREFGGEGGAPRERDGNRRDFGDRKPRDFGDRREGGFKRDFGGRPGGDKRSFGDRPEGGFRREGREEREGGFRKPAFRRSEGEQGGFRREGKSDFRPAGEGHEGGFTRRPPFRRDALGTGFGRKPRDGEDRGGAPRERDDNRRDFGDRKPREFGDRSGSGPRTEGGFRKEGGEFRRDNREGGFGDRKPSFRRNDGEQGDRAPRGDRNDRGGFRREGEGGFRRDDRQERTGGFHDRKPPFRKEGGDRPAGPRFAKGPLKPHRKGEGPNGPIRARSKPEGEGGDGGNGTGHADD